MPKEIIEMVNKLAQNAPQGLTFHDDKGSIFDENEKNISDEYECINP
jgi:hypothetical protein